jgi:hypothetical protein
VIAGAKITGLDWTGLDGSAVQTVKAVQSYELVSTPFLHAERRPRTVSRSFPRILPLLTISHSQSDPPELPSPNLWRATLSILESADICVTREFPCGVIQNDSCSIKRLLRGDAAYAGPDGFTEERQKVALERLGC